MAKDEIKGILLMVGSVLSFAIMASLIKMLSDINSVTTVFFRFSVSIGIMSFLALTKVIKLNFTRSPLLLLRGLTGGIATYLFYLSIVKLGMGKGTVYVYSYPIFATLFSVIFLKERVTFGIWALIFTAFVGIYVLSLGKGGFQFFSFSFYELLAITSSVFSALSITIVKKLHATDSTYAIFFAQATVGFWIFIFPANTIAVDITNWQFLLLIIAGITAVIGQLIMTEGYKFIPVSLGTSMHMLVPVLSLIIAYLFFNETLNGVELIGTGIIIAVCIVLPWLQSRNSGIKKAI